MNLFITTYCLREYYIQIWLPWGNLLSFSHTRFHKEMLKNSRRPLQNLQRNQLFVHITSQSTFTGPIGNYLLNLTF